MKKLFILMIVGAIAMFSACNSEKSDRIIDVVPEESFDLVIVKTDEPDATIIIEPTNEPTIEPTSTPEKTPEPTPTPKPTPEKTPEPTPTPKKESSKNYLILVNWDNPLKENYVPSDLVKAKSIIGDVVAYRNDSAKLDRRTAEAALAMFKAAKKDGIKNLFISSAYRSIDAQRDIEKRRREKDPTYFDDPYNHPVIAMPHNMSEHSTGLAIDILLTTMRNDDQAFADTEQGKWLAKNAHKYGFILRYPKDKEHITGVIFEPWHFRYVGVDAATEIYERKICLEEYFR